jgi:hypothetical protein
MTPPRHQPYGTILFCSSTRVFIDMSFRAGGVVEYRREKVPQSKYQRRMDAETEELDDAKGPSVESNDDVGSIRYWSDFSRVYYLPRSLQKLPDPPEWEESSLNWTQGQESFKRFNEVALSCPILSGGPLLTSFKGIRVDGWDATSLCRGL